MMNQYDVMVIGGGLIGAFVARNLSRYDLEVAVLEKNPDICSEITRANTAIVYSGYDHRPNTLKARLCIEGNRTFGHLCRELGVSFRRCGSLMVAFGPNGERMLRRKYEQGQENGLQDLKLLSSHEAMLYEPNLNPGVSCALYSPTTGTVNPWELGIAAAKNAAANGVSFYLNTEVLSMSANDGWYVGSTGTGSFKARAVINCAGLAADLVHGWVNTPHFRLVPTRGDYFILDTKANGFVEHVLFYEPEERGEGTTVVPTVDGNILLGPSNDPVGERLDFSTSREGLDHVQKTARKLLPDIPLACAIRTFSAIRPNPYYLERDETGGDTLSDRSIHTFVIEQSPEHPGFISAAGIKTPGLTAANGIGSYITDLALAYLGAAAKKPDYNPILRKDKRFSRMTLAEKQGLPSGQTIVCRCRQVTEAEIRAAIQKPLGAVSVDGLKRRTGMCMGRCQGGYCLQRAAEILAEELGIPISQVVKTGSSSNLFREEG